MKPRLIPIYFDPGRDDGFDTQLAVLHHLLGDTAEFLPPVALGQPLPTADAVIFPQILGQAYRSVDVFKSIDLPILIVTSEFGTMAMWDWEIGEYLRCEGVDTIAPYDLRQLKVVIASLRVKRELAKAKFLVFQDDPGQGAQAPIFKRFYWWEDECTRRMMDKFGITLVKESFRELGQEMQQISDGEADHVWQQWNWPTEGIDGRPLRSAVKLYITVKRRLDADPDIRSVGINCLNESHFCDTTPCLAWSMLYEERKLIWGCEADTMSMLTKYILHESLDVPILMTNLYPFLLGQAALRHERIAAFPDVDVEPENHVLIAHCGYMGVIPKSFATRWTLKKKVLAIVDENATAIDAEFPTGPITLAKLHPNMSKMTVAEGDLKGYAQFPDSDCLNGGIVKVGDGHKLMRTLASHHYLLTQGKNLNNIQFMAPIFDLNVDVI